MVCRGNSPYHKMDKRGSIGCEAYYSRINSTKFPDLGVATVSEPRLVLQVGRVRGVVYTWRSVCCCSQSGGDAIILLLTWQLQPCD